VNGSYINNQGTFTKNSTDSNTIRTIFNNTGTVIVNAGILALSYGGTHTGSFAHLALPA